MIYIDNSIVSTIIKPGQPRVLLYCSYKIDAEYRATETHYSFLNNFHGVELNLPLSKSGLKVLISGILL